MLAALLSADLFHYLLIFTRIGAALMAMPAFGELTVSPRVRLIFALALAAVLLPVLGTALPALPASPSALVLLLAGEVFVGVVIGLMARIVMSCLQVAGTIVAYHTGMASAMVTDMAAAGQQGAIAGAFLSTLGLVVLFTTDLHHLLLRGLVESYAVFEPGAAPPAGDIADHAARLVAEAFAIGLKIALPVVIVGLVLYVAMGLMARLMPQMQVFFIVLPVQIVAGLAVFALTLAVGMGVFHDFMTGSLARLLGG